MSSSNIGAWALSGTARKNAPSISAGISPSTSRLRTEISNRRGVLLPMKWMVCGKAFMASSVPVIQSWRNANGCYNRREGQPALRRLKGMERVLERAERDTRRCDKVAMLHQLLKLTNRLMAPFSTHLAHRYKISLNEFRLLMTIGALGRSASHEL